jgi:hypothetical protein
MMIKHLSSDRAAAIQGFTDDFTDDRRAGKVIGSHTPSGLLRRGIDTERVIGIDNRALRIQPLIQSGWGRAGMTYGAYHRQNGLAMAIFMINGHNTSQAENLPDTFFARLQRWWLGSETYGRKQRLLQWLCSKRKARMIRQVRWWLRIHKHAQPVPRIDENLAVGWFSSEVPTTPLQDGNAFIMHATGPENGELWVRAGGNTLRAIRGVQNLQVYYVVILRDQGAAYYIASVPGAHGLSAFPQIRPVAVDPFGHDDPVYPGLSQSVLGQIGFRLDTRVYGVRVEHLPELSEWYGTAHAADQLKGSGILRWSDAEVGGLWRTCGGEFERCPEGARSLGDTSLALVDPEEPSGLVHVICQTGSQASMQAGLVWRFQDEDNFWRLLITDRSCQLSIKINGVWEDIARSEEWHLLPDTAHTIQVLDDGRTMSVYLQGNLLFGSWFHDERLQHATGVGLCAPEHLGRDSYLHSFEAHPRTITLSDRLDIGHPWFRKGDHIILADDFEGPPGELAGRLTSLGGKVWKKEIGAGVMKVSGHGSVKIQATTQCPNPGRTAYTVDWDYPEFADVEVNITPPGDKKGQKEHGLCGFIFWQDPDNYITVNIWVSDSYGGASISCFFHLDGFEDLYDAIWSNVGQKVYFGVPVTLRMVFDGCKYTVFVDGQPVLYRALTDVYQDYGRFSINRVGLLANWEWGNDTGSTFQQFVGRV